MSLTLLVENNPRIESCYTLNLSTWLGLTTIVRKSAELAIKCLDNEASSIQLIIVRIGIEKEESAKILVKYVQNNGLKIPVIEIGPGEEVPGCVARVPNSLEIKILIQSAAKALNITAKDMSTKVVPDFFPIPTSYFKILKHASSPIYTQNLLDKSKYDLLYKKNSVIEEADINKLLNNDIASLYENKLERLELVNVITSEFMSQLDRKDLSQDEEISATDKSIELLSKKLLAIGVNEETIKLAHKSMDTIRRNVKSQPKLSKLIERMLSNKTSYLFKHTQILTFIGLHITKNMDWGNAEQENKMSFIAFFHDIVLENDQQAQIKSTLELKKVLMEPTAKILVEKHAQLAAEFVAKFPHAPMGSDQIIRQHHGTLNGVGFSEHYGANVSPVAVVFIVAEEFTRIILKRESGPFDRMEMLRELKEQFPTSRFQKVIDTLQSITF